jgi:hypothetical protein
MTQPTNIKTLLVLNTVIYLFIGWFALESSGFGDMLKFHNSLQLEEHCILGRNPNISEEHIASIFGVGK